MNTIDSTHAWHFGRDGKPDRLVTIVTLPIKTVSEMNAREHWARRAARSRQARQLAAWGAGAVLAEYRKSLEQRRPGVVHVLLTRIAPRQLDDDNLRSALKATRDGITDALGLHCDRDGRLRWDYEQARGEPKQYAVKVTVWREP